MMRMMLVIVVAIAATGCWAPGSPRTSVGFNPWTKSIEFTDTKDNRVALEEASYNNKTGAFTMKGLEIDNSASQVLREQVEQMKVWADEMRVANEGLAIVGDRIVGALDKLDQIVNPIPRMLTAIAEKVTDTVAAAQSKGEPPADESPPTDPKPANTAPQSEAPRPEGGGP